MDKLQFTRGDDEDFEITIKDVDGDAVNITGATLFFTLKDKIKNTDAEAIISKNITVHSAPLEGKSILTIAAEDTIDMTPGTYYWDIQVKLSSGVIQSSNYGVAVLVPDITRRIVS